MAMYFVIANIITVVLIGIMMALFEGRSGKGYDLSLAMPAVFANILTFTPCILFVYFIRRKVTNFYSFDSVWTVFDMDLFGPIT